jgi:hypothetical protein
VIEIRWELASDPGSVLAENQLRHSSRGIDSEEIAVSQGGPRLRDQSVGHGPERARDEAISGREERDQGRTGELQSPVPPGRSGAGVRLQYQDLDFDPVLVPDAFHRGSQGGRIVVGQHGYR